MSRYKCYIRFTMVGKYTKEDLTHGGDTPEEHERLRAIFDDLVSGGTAGKKLSMVEQEFVFHGLMFFNENPYNFPFVEEAQFRAHYLTYSFDLTGGSKYWTSRGGQYIQVPPFERDNHLNYLHAEAERWKKKVDANHNYPEGLMKEVAKEAREDRKNLDKYYNIVGRPELVGTFFYENLTSGLYLRAGANYIFGKKYWEETDSEDLSFAFCGEIIEFTEYSMIHILNRHFSEGTKQYPSGKDYHTEDIIPWAMPKQVKEIMTQIDASGLLKKQKKTEVNLKYKGEIYQFWADYKDRFIKGHKRPIQYKRVQSFYRATDSGVLAKLKSDYREVSLSTDLSVFVPI